VINRVFKAATDETCNSLSAEVEHSERTAEIIVRMEAMDSQLLVFSTFLYSFRDLCGDPDERCNFWA